MFYLIPISVMLFVDRITKLMVIAAADGRVGQLYEVFPFFNIVMVWNTGVSFSLFAGHGEWGRWILVVLASAITAFLIRLMLQAKNRITGMAYAMVIAGAVGNIWDRIQYGAVADFLDFHLRGVHFPSFNVADSLIFLGVVVLLFRKD